LVKLISHQQVITKLQLILESIANPMPKFNF
jgi:hypothetical protein